MDADGVLIYNGVPLQPGSIGFWPTKCSEIVSGELVIKIS